jgi:hypothetical protein
LEQVQNLESGSFVIYLGHGRSDSLYGSIADNSGALVSPDAVAYGAINVFRNERFIDSANIDVFADKNIFCLACNAGLKRGIGQIAVDSGATSFLGFGEIPTSQEEFKERLNYPRMPNHIVQRYKGEMCQIISTSLQRTLERQSTIEDLRAQIAFQTNQAAYELIKRHKKFRGSILLANALYCFRRQMILWGDGSAEI